MLNARFKYKLPALLFAGSLFMTSSVFAKDDPCVAFIAQAGGSYNQQEAPPKIGFFGMPIPNSSETELKNPAEACKSDYLCRISLYTYCTLIGVSDLVVNILKSDKSDFTANNATNFSTLGTGLAQNIKTQNQPDTQKTLLDDFFQDGLSKRNVVKESSLPIALNMPATSVANELTYQTLLGMPYFKTAETYSDGTTKVNVDSALKYIENAAGLTLTHQIPQSSWRGDEKNIDRYIKYYKTISAVQTYNGYILSSLYANYVNNPKNPTNLTTTQMTLMQNASSSDWLTKVATQSIGEVFRQMLLFNSQSYVLLAQMAKTQQDMLAAQAMTNTLLVLSNQSTELALLQFANP